MDSNSGAASLCCCLKQQFAEVAKLVPKGVVCLLSATQFHRLTVHTPSAVWLAIERTARKPRIDCPPMRIVRFGGTAFTMGVEENAIEGSLRALPPLLWTDKA